MMMMVAAGTRDRWHDGGNVQFHFFAPPSRHLEGSRRQLVSHARGGSFPTATFSIVSQINIDSVIIGVAVERFSFAPIAI